jgi:hypothetical protein
VVDGHVGGCVSFDRGDEDENENKDPDEDEDVKTREGKLS